MRFLISAHTGLGNFILKTPLVRAIKERYPDAEVDLLYGSPWGAEEVLRGSDLISHTYWCSVSSSWLHKLRIMLVLRQRKYEIVLFPFDSTPNYLRYFSFFLRSGCVVSHFHVPIRKLEILRFVFLFLTSGVRHFVPVIPGRHECHLNLDLLEPVLNYPTERDLRTFVSWKREDVSRFGVNDNYIVIQIGARNGQPTPKTWKPSNFFELIERLQEKHDGLQFVLIGDLADRKFLEGVIPQSKSVINLLGMTSFNELCNIISGARLVLAHDSGAMHLADALNCPLVALYGPTDFTRTMPLGPNSHVLFSCNECWAKMYAFRVSEEELSSRFQDHFCMSGISVDLVFSKIDFLLMKDQSSDLDF